MADFAGYTDGNDTIVESVDYFFWGRPLAFTSRQEQAEHEQDANNHESNPFQFINLLLISVVSPISSELPCAGTNRTTTGRFQQF